MPAAHKAPTKAPSKKIDVLFLFNPVDCRSLGVVRMALEPMAKGEILEVTANAFQHREIEALMKKLKHRVVEIVDEVGQLKIYIEKHGLKDPVAPSQ